MGGPEDRKHREEHDLDGRNGNRSTISRQRRFWFRIRQANRDRSRGKRNLLCVTRVTLGCDAWRGTPAELNTTLYPALRLSCWNHAQAGFWRGGWVTKTSLLPCKRRKNNQLQGPSSKYSRGMPERNQEQYRMATASTTPSANGGSGLSAKQVFGLAAVSLCAGLIIGYSFLGKPGHFTTAKNQPAPNSTAASVSMPGGHPKLTLEQMKQMADVQASTLVEQSKTDPNNSALLLQIAGIYQASHQFKEASDYFARALKLDPKNVTAHTDLASSLYYSGDVDGALKQLNEALKYNPKDPNSLFNLGMIKYRGKNDAAGAIAAWQQLLKTNPSLDRKQVVEKMIAEAKAGTGSKN
jgi:cytochrome c-type biogenesis protein CcmH/NrfG